MGQKDTSKYIEYVLPYQDSPMMGPQSSYAARSKVILKQIRTGADDPMYKTKIARGENATNSLVGSKQDIIYTTGLLVTKELSNYGNKNMIAKNYFCGLLPTAVNVDVPKTLINDAQNEAAIAIRNKIQSQQDNFSGLQFLGELRETIHQIKHPAESLFNLTHKFAKKAKKVRQKVGPKYFGDAIAGSWLEFAFGAQPLYNDIVEIAKSSIARVDMDQIIRLRASRTREDATSRMVEFAAGGANVSVFYTNDDVSRAQVTYVVGYRMAVNGCSDALTNIIDQGGFRFDQIIPTAWELLPWSFFIDYFGNIGDVLSSSLVRMDRVAWSRKTVRTTFARTYANGVPKAGGKPVNQEIVKFVSPTSYAIKSNVERAAASIPFGELRFELPGRTSQLFNIGALATLQITNFK